MVGFASSFPNHSADDWVREQLGLLWFVCVLKEPSLRGAPSWLAAATWGTVVKDGLRTHLHNNSIHMDFTANPCARYLFIFPQD